MGRRMGTFERHGQGGKQRPPRRVTGQDGVAHRSTRKPMSPDPIVARCEACRKLQPRSEHGQAAHFPMRCTACGEGTEIIALLPIATSGTPDREWRVRLLDDPADRAGDGPGVRTAECMKCRARCDILDDPLSGASPWEMHFPAWCPSCRAATEVSTRGPAAATRSADEREWYVVELEADEAERFRHRIDPWPDDWPS
jgi:hypothetical protein